MLLTARLLNDVSSVNSWEASETVEWTIGDTVTVYLQLVDGSVDRSTQGFSPPGRRYCPVAGSTLSIQINSVDSTRSYTKTATQPFAGDTSIWSFTVSATDLISGTRDLLLTLTESGIARHGRVNGAVTVHTVSETC